MEIYDMYQMISQRYGYGPTVDKVRESWYAMDFNISGYITRQEFSRKTKYEIKRILSQPSYGAQPNIVLQPGYGAQPGYGQPGFGGPHHGGPHFGGPGYVGPSYPQQSW